MGVLTTTIGAYPKPGYLDLPDWWRDSREGEYYTFNYVDDYEAAVVRLGEELEPLAVRSTISSPRTWFVVVPYLRVCGPPAFSATLPPMVQACWLEGSGA